MRTKHRDNAAEQIIRQAEQAGARVSVLKSGHYRILGSCGHAGCTASFGGTSSDWRAVKNFSAQIRRMLACSGH